MTKKSTELSSTDYDNARAMGIDEVEMHRRKTNRNKLVRWAGRGAAVGTLAAAGLNGLLPDATHDPYGTPANLTETTSTTEAVTPVTHRVVVQPGDTVWEIAQRVEAGDGTRGDDRIEDIVADIERANGGNHLVPGQALTIEDPHNQP